MSRARKAQKIGRGIRDDGPKLSPPPPAEIKLDLGCGQSPREGFEGVDIVAGPKVKHVVNLWKFPWPWKTDSICELFASHVIEHVPMAFISPKGEYKLVPDGPEDQDLLLRFFDECWRILKPGGKMMVVVPACGSDRAFQDPTHRRFIASNTFLYLSGHWRESQKLDHYNVKCRFKQTVDAVPGEPASRMPEVQARMSRHYRNYISDFVANLEAVKEEPKG